ncbi:MAG: 50S ribosomal protein L6 [Candidatus Woesearchaeota archaeon]
MVPEKKLKLEIEAPEGIEIKLDGKILTIKGPKGEVSKKFDVASVDISSEGNKVKLSPKKFTKRQKMFINTFEAHINNMLKGTKEGFEYKLKICSSHFPMSVSVEGDNVIIKNFLGEKVNRKALIVKGANVKIQADTITVTSADKETAGQTAANMEQATRITNRDRRIFQDGIWITEKAGKEM